MKAEELNTLVTLSCTEPRWELVKFSFEDSPEEAMNYYRSKEAGYPKGVYYNLDRDILILKAELQSNSDVFPRAVYYMRVDVGDVSDTDKLQKWWECNTEWLGKKLVEMVKGEIVVEYRLRPDTYYKGHVKPVGYTLIDVFSSSRREMVFDYLVDFSEGARYEQRTTGINPAEKYVTRVVTDYLKGVVTEENNQAQCNPFESTNIKTKT